MSFGIVATKKHRKPGRIPESLACTTLHILHSAWAIMLQNINQGESSLSICQAKENEISWVLYDIIASLHKKRSKKIAGLDLFESPYFDTPVRTGPNGKFKRPDLSFCPLDRNAIPGESSATARIFVECKPIGKKHSVGSHYCSEGIKRFVKGEYAKQVDRGIMLGYVRNICYLPDGLLHALNKSGMKKRYKTDGKLRKRTVKVKNSSTGIVVHMSKHKRDGKLYRNKGKTYPIVLYHLWLKPKAPCDNSKCKGCR